jgi:hypothetical protein
MRIDGGWTPPDEYADRTVFAAAMVSSSDARRHLPLQDGRWQRAALAVQRCDGELAPRIVQASAV